MRQVACLGPAAYAVNDLGTDLFGVALHAEGGGIIAEVEAPDTEGRIGAGASEQ